MIANRDESVVDSRAMPPELALLKELQGELDFVVRNPLNVMSENMHPENWLTISNAIRYLTDVEQIDGVLVLHGTDTATFTTAALSYMCADRRIPIVLTGSNLPAVASYSDAPNNILGACIALPHLSPGVYLSFSGRRSGWSTVFLGTRVRKLHAGGQPYKSIGCPVLARVSPLGEFTWRGSREIVNPDGDPLMGIHIGVESRSMLMPLYPGIDFDTARAAVKSSGTRTVVLQLYGSLSGPHDDTVKFIGWCRDNSVTIVGCPHEPPRGNLLDYESTAAFRGAGMTLIPTMLPETAYVKACWLGALDPTPEKLAALMSVPIANDILDQHSIRLN